MQSGPDLVGAGYPISRPLTSLLGGTSNASQPNIPARTNLDYGLGNLVDGTAPTSGVCVAVAVPVLPGDVVTKVAVLVGATAASGPTNAFAALYAGTGSAPVLIGQTTTTGSAAITASGVLTFTFGTPQTITAAQAPNGFIYVSILTAASSTVPTLVSVTSTTAALYQWYSTGPLFVGASHGSGVTTTAPSTIASPSAVAKAPVVIVT